MPPAAKPALDEAAYSTLEQVGIAKQRLVDHFEIGLTACRNVKQSIFKEDEVLDIKSDDDDPSVVVATYAGTSVRFQIFLGATENGQVVGRIVCSHQYNFHGKMRFKYLDEFTIMADGRTNFASDGFGRPVFIGSSADLIVAHFLKKALEHNLVAKE